MVEMTGGILLILGAFFVYRGNIFGSVVLYLFADVCWLIMSISSGNIIGSVLIFIGMILGLLAFLKMNSGEFNKHISKESKESKNSAVD